VFKEPKRGFNLRHLAELEKPYYHRMSAIKASAIKSSLYLPADIFDSLTSEETRNRVTVAFQI
jgi:hypothetical protein